MNFLKYFYVVFFFSKLVLLENCARENIVAKIWKEMRYNIESVVVIEDLTN